MFLKWLLILIGYLSTFGIWTSLEAVDVFAFTALAGACFGLAMWIDFGRRMK